LAGETLFVPVVSLGPLTPCLPHHHPHRHEPYNLKVDVYSFAMILFQLVRSFGRSLSAAPAALLRHAEYPKQTLPRAPRRHHPPPPRQFETTTPFAGHDPVDAARQAAMLGARPGFPPRNNVSQLTAVSGRLCSCTASSCCINFLCSTRPTNPTDSKPNQKPTARSCGKSSTTAGRQTPRRAPPSKRWWCGWRGCCGRCRSTRPTRKPTSPAARCSSGGAGWVRMILKFLSWYFGRRASRWCRRVCTYVNVMIML
jgi:hypothetical protein